MIYMNQGAIDAGIMVGQLAAGDDGKVYTVDDGEEVVAPTPGLGRSVRERVAEELGLELVDQRHADFAREMR